MIGWRTAFKVASLLHAVRDLVALDTETQWHNYYLINHFRFYKEVIISGFIFEEFTSILQFFPVFWSNIHLGFDMRINSISYYIVRSSSFETSGHFHQHFILRKQFTPKITTTNCIYRKASGKTLLYKKLLIKYWWNWHLLVLRRRSLQACENPSLLLSGRESSELSRRPFTTYS